MKYKNKSTFGIEHFYALKAKEYLSKLLFNTNAYFLDEDVDVYNRVVSRIMIDDIDISIRMVYNGFARVGYISCDPQNYFYYSDYSYIKKLLYNETNAKINKRGFWANINMMKQIFPKTNIIRPNSC